MYSTHSAAPRMKDELIAAIHEHCTSNPDRVAYVVPRSEMRERAERSPDSSADKFVVVALPDVPATQIDHTAQQLQIEVRVRPDGTDVECLTLAGGTVAISGRAIQAAGADTNGQLLIAWMFADSIEFTEYLLSIEHIEQMQAAQQFAQSNARFTLREAAGPLETNEQAIEVFEHVVVEFEPAP
ncbi:hypothetical protein [Paraburkholderia sp. BL6665CI2N2]|uniref:hypothetical protein n=1 Tax=Paraburkholderia sp. BL6665CI2N2 TaxID=1938806 RepID=UPI00106481C5|nr:hypothetical protein [Paraburkholderia sp. BL6665CI2N2]